MSALPEYLTAHDVADRLKLHPNKVYELAASGELPSYKIGGSRRFHPDEVQRFLDERCREKIAPVQEIPGRRR